MIKKRIKNKAFTLVELIVSITILSILGTIAFISMQGFAKEARDSTRVSDITTMQKAIVFYQNQEGSLPLPDKGEEISYSGSLVWTQGVFGAGLIRELRSITTKPVDPLTGDEYTYSVLNTGQEFQVAGVLEGAQAYTPTIISPTYASSITGRAYVKGNYNGKVAKTSSGSTTYILAIPSIISSDMSLLDIEELISNQNLVYNNQNAIPASFSSEEFDTTQFFDYEPSQIVVFSGSVDDLNNIEAQVELIANIQTAYSGTPLEELNTEIASIIELDIDVDNPSDDVKSIANTILKNTLNYDIVSYSAAESAESEVVEEIELGPCGLSDQDVIDLNDFFDYSGSTYQFDTAEEWCDLKVINISSKSIDKELPESIGNLESLLWLAIKSSGVTGELPVDLGNNMSNLKYMSFYQNDLTGSIPSSFGSLSLLEDLILYKNSLSGEIPPEIGNMSSLELLNVSYNDLSGKIPSEIGKLSNLESLSARSNDLEGEIPSSFSNLSVLSWLDLAENNFTGSLPTNMGDMTELSAVYLYSNDFSVLPDSMANLKNVKTLSIFSNNDLGNLSQSFKSTSSAYSQSNITETGKTMEIVGNGTTLDITVY